MIYNIIEDEDIDNDTDKILVVSNRGDFKSKVMKTRTEVVEKISKFALDNKIIGFKMDW